MRITFRLSTAFPQLFHRYQDKNLTLTARAVKEVPTVNLSETEAVVRIPAALDVYVNDTDHGTWPVAFTMNVVSQAKITLNFSTNRCKKEMLFLL